GCSTSSSLVLARRGWLRPTRPSPHPAPPPRRGEGEGKEDPDMRRMWIVRGVLGLLFVAWLLTGITEVRPGQQAVVRRFGRVLDVQPRAGLWIGLPWGIDVVDRISVDQERRVVVGYRPEEGFDEQTPPGQLLTGDHNLVNVQVVVTYSVDPDAVVDYVEQRDRVEELIARATEALLAH